MQVSFISLGSNATAVVECAQFHGEYYILLQLSYWHVSGYYTGMQFSFISLGSNATAHSTACKWFVEPSGQQYYITSSSHFLEGARSEKQPWISNFSLIYPAQTILTMLLQTCTKFNVLGLSCMYKFMTTCLPLVHHLYCQSWI